MIYLIDDNQHNQRAQNYGAFFVDNGEYEGYLTSVTRLPKMNSFAQSNHLDFLKEAKCILLHSTTEDVDENGKYISGSRSNAIKIIEQISEEGDKIPLVLFSNSMDEQAIYDHESSPNYIQGIKKNKLYERLRDFLEHYRATGAIELRIIARGKNYKANEVIEIVNELLNPVAMQPGENMITIDLVAKDKFKQLIESVYPDLNWKDLLYDLEDADLSIGEFRNKLGLIKEDYLKYGRNIHTW